VDCANGAAYNIAPHVFTELGANVIPIANEPDGFNINHECGSTQPELLRKTVLEKNADLGLALDGDGDRVIMVDNNGNIIDGDQMLYVIAHERQRSGRLRGGVVGTLMSNLGLEHACGALNIPFRRAAVGDRYVLAMLHDQGWDLGGETSGHIICLDRSTTGDGIIAALQVLLAMIGAGKTLADISAGMEIYPQSMINVRMKRRFDVKGSVFVQQAIKQVEKELGNAGRVVLRASGTEPVIRVMVEGRDAEQVARLSRHLADTVQRAADQAA
jgi:phosphoglucosamine mutase